jgi:hypothetical protein
MSLFYIIYKSKFIYLYFILDFELKVKYKSNYKNSM